MNSAFRIRYSLLSFYLVRGTAIPVFSLDSTRGQECRIFAEKWLDPRRFRKWNGNNGEEKFSKC